MTPEKITGRIAWGVSAPGPKDIISGALDVGFGVSFPEEPAPKAENSAFSNDKSDVVIYYVIYLLWSGGKARP